MKKMVFILSLVCILTQTGCGKEAAQEDLKQTGEVASQEWIDYLHNKALFEGMPIWNVYLTDLNSDGLPELCATVSIGSGIIDNRIIVYDYAVQEAYELSDRGEFDYNLTMQDNQLIVTKSNYNANYDGTVVATGTLVLNSTEENPKITVLFMERET